MSGDREPAKILGLLGHDQRDVPPEEVRFAVVLNGGVSLAVWMGGVTLELDQLVKARDRRVPVYEHLLRLTGCSARVDIVSGTSAGGINGAALALAQVNRLADIAQLRHVWAEQGRIEALLRQPVSGSPASLLKGDEHFLPELNAAMARLAWPHDIVSAVDAPMELTMMTTLLTPTQTVTVDALGQRLPQAMHSGRFQWSRPRHGSTDADPFGSAHVVATAAELALAARSSSSFPVAFEPSFVPVQAAGPIGRPEARRPDMRHVVQDWGEPGSDRSRFVVDGGVLANTPTRQAIQAMEQLPAEGPVRRVMLLVYPHAPSPDDIPADDPTSPPTLTGTLAGVLGALSAQGSRTFVEEVTAHNRRASARRGTRSEILARITQGVASNAADELEALAKHLFEHYRWSRRSHAARTLAGRVIEDGTPVSGSDHDPWDYERVRRAAERAQAHGIITPVGGRPELPYVPLHLPTRQNPEQQPLWGWGHVAAIGVGEAVNEVLRELSWIVPTEGPEVPRPDHPESSRPAGKAVADARKTVTEALQKLHQGRADLDRVWSQDPLSALLPDPAYWTLRLTAYARWLTGGSEAAVDASLDTVLEGEFRRAVVRGADAAQERERMTALRGRISTMLLREEAGEVGALVRHEVDTIIAALRDALPALRTYCTPGLDQTSPRWGLGNLDLLNRWRDLLAPSDEVESAEQLLTTLLHLEIASVTLGDGTPTGLSIPVELVQLSAQTDNAFAHYSRTGDDKLGGWSINRFGGFLKRSWRVNDWTWGRLDAATALCRTVLDPERVRRTAVLAGYLTTNADPTQLAQQTLTGITTSLMPGDPLAGDARYEHLVAGARDELTRAFNLEVEREDLPATMPSLAAIFAWARQLDLIPLEMSALAAAVRQDDVEGASPRSRGMALLKEEQPLLSRLESALGHEEPVRPSDRVRLLTAFDRAGVGREDLSVETSSDLVIRSASTAGAVTTSVLDSPSSGLAAVRPVTKVLRGAMLVVHWTIVGLTSRSVIPRTLAMLGLALGSVLLVASLLGALPESWSGPASLIGSSCLLAAFAFGALRTGTFLHGLVLLSPLVPLLTYAFTLPAATAGTDGMPPEGAVSAARGAVTLAAMAGLVLGLFILGSLPASHGSVWEALGRLTEQRGVPSVDTQDLPRRKRWWIGTCRRVTALWRSLPSVALPLAALAAPVAVAWAISQLTAHRVQNELLAARTPITWVALAAVSVGAAAAFWFGDLLRPLGRRVPVPDPPTSAVGPAGNGSEGGEEHADEASPASDEPNWVYVVLSDRLGVTASWAVLYGFVYLGVGLIVLWRGFGVAPGMPAATWLVALVVTALVLGLVLTAVYPLVVPLVVLRRHERRELARDAVVARFRDRSPAAGDVPDLALRWHERRSYAVDLAERGVGYRWLVSRTEGEDGARPSLTPRGVELLRRLDQAKDDELQRGLSWRVDRMLWWFRRRRP